MTDVFISYARASEVQAKQVEQRLRDCGYAVWRDAELPAHRTYADVIEERLKAAKAVVVLWSAEGTKSQWVRAEADAARELGTLIQASVDGTMPPIPFNQIQCADLKEWNGEAEDAGWRKVQASVVALVGGADESESSPKPRRHKRSICVLPFANMSGDAEQEYFSDGISEDITTDLSKVSALEVIARNTAFTFKEQSVDVTEVARKLSVSHVLEGSVRKSGNRVRITAQLIDGTTGGHLWADRYDRELTDIFAIQDEISKAIVDALKVKLLPEEKKAIEQRGTTSAEAYNLYLMARQYWLTGNHGDVRREERVIEFCDKALALDGGYARAIALKALATNNLFLVYGLGEQSGLALAERALEIDPSIAVGYCVRARCLSAEGRDKEAATAFAVSLALDPEGWEVNREYARWAYNKGLHDIARRHFEIAVAASDDDYHSWMLLGSACRALGDMAAAQHAAREGLEKVRKILQDDPSNGAAIQVGAGFLLDTGEPKRAREWMERAILIDPGNFHMRYNFACMFVCGGEYDSALDVLEKLDRSKLARMAEGFDNDPDLNPLRKDPRFVALREDLNRYMKPES